MLTEKPKFENLGRYYLIALCAIAASIIISQALVQQYISEQKNDSRVVNLSGRQRMLSQRISKCALLLGTSANPADRAERRNELETALDEWRKAHDGLQHGDDALGVKGHNSRAIDELFTQINADHQQMASAAQRLINNLTHDINIPADSLRADINTIIKHEGAFLRGMDEVVFQYDDEAKTKVMDLKKVEIFIMIFSLGVIVMELFFIFFPLARSIRKTIDNLSEAREKAKKMALEVSALYNSLEQAYQDLLEADVRGEEDFMLYAKCDGNGDFSHFYDRFTASMEFDMDKPANLFDWLQEQGHSEEHLQRIKDMVLVGESWNGGIKVTNTAGDFVWLKLNIVPTMDEQGKVETLMVIGSDETEKKEAMAISREINRERIAKSVKEQQFRSALILEGQEEERKRISRDMHDGVGQLLSAMKFNLEGIQSINAGKEREKLKASRELLKNVIKEVRRISFNLTPSALSDYGIVRVLSKFCREITKISGLKVTFENKTGFLSRLEGKVENNIYRIVQEAVNNAIKYAEATEVKVIISHNSQYLSLEIKDDGKGFDIKKLEEKGHFSATGHGIFNIRERANFINGDCRIFSVAGQGTTISINIPLE
ncbi:sensor histidine kinase [Parapedobacter tibetensis]|uniref:sensor histidine kinase n=1 Tax=Parapedobacter tibetensis TaxID=2972951 RepID=UPI00214D6197|nr:type IV pili methyl-accepting chemotaxis transducer N-terminal domain-containing protein [Parapedobacter tibetensis]